MTTRTLEVFFDTSVIFAAVLSPSGGARTLLRLGEIGILNPIIGPNVLRECESVIRRKATSTLPSLAAMLDISRFRISGKPNPETLAQAKLLVSYPPDRYVLAEAIASRPDWFVTHDKQHFITLQDNPALEFTLGTPGDLIQHLAGRWTG